MKKLNYKLIVSDFDGTLINSEQQIPEEVKKAVKHYVSDGGIFAVCSGRMLCSILPRVRELGLKGLVIAYQGTAIADIETGNIIKFGGMESGDAAEVCRNIEELNHPVNVYSDDVMYTDIPKENEYLKVYEKIVNIDAKHVDGKLSEFVSAKNLFCQKISVLVAPDEQAELYAELCNRLGRKYDVTCSASVLVEVSPLSDNKGEALKFLAERYGIPMEKTIAVGDNLNDLSMIEAAGLGVAVGKAVQPLKNAAAFVTVTNTDGAIAKIIEEFGYIK